MAGADPLVAVDPTQFVHAFHSADEESLEVQFQGDPQEEGDVQGVVVGGKRPGRRSASNRVQRRAFDFDVAFAIQGAADRLEDFGAFQEAVHHAVRVDQVQVPHPLPQFRIGQPVMFFWGGQDGFGEEMESFGKNCQFAGAGVLQLAVHADDIAQVEQEGQLPILGADLVLADHDLDSAGPVLQVQKNQLPFFPLQHDASGSPHLRSGLLGLSLGLVRGRRRGNDFLLPLANLVDRLVIVKAATPGIDPQRFQLAQLFAAGCLVHARIAAAPGWLLVRHRNRCHISVAARETGEAAAGYSELWLQSWATHAPG